MASGDGLCNWQDGNSLMERNAKWYTNLQHVLIAKGMQFIQHIGSGQRPESDGQLQHTKPVVHKKDPFKKDKIIIQTVSVNISNNHNDRRAKFSEGMERLIIVDDPEKEDLSVSEGTNNNNYGNTELILDIAKHTQMQAVLADWCHSSENKKLPELLHKNDFTFTGNQWWYSL
ncbi:uncharacterized protein LOC127878237 [Dreissena polymorpha]|uniref:uncharacterized protein LOC127878237 n=1 Tax=Dreissena polymorpha TaxID=45954 RepID=UPI0022644783|nr:uncharacterized protein LOC127878237 [Dreissena polymorpha]